MPPLSKLLLLPIAWLTLLACSEQPTDTAEAANLLPTVAGPGSRTPHLAPAPDGSIIMSWLEPSDHGFELRYATLGGETWSSPRTIARGTDWFVNWADYPSVVALDESLWTAHWLVKSAAGTYEYDVAVSISIDGGNTWQDPLTPHTDDTLAEHGFVSLYPMPGGVGALWLDGRNHDTGMTLRSAVIGPDGQLSAGQQADELVCDCCPTDVAIGREGPIAVYRNRTADEIRDIHVLRMSDGRWGDDQPVANDGWKIAGCPVNGPAIDTDGDNVAVAWLTAAEDKPRVQIAFSSDGARSFAKPIDINSSKPLGRVDTLMLEDGQTLVSWLEQGPDGAGHIRLRTVAPDGSLGLAVTAARTGSGRLSGFPQIARHGNDVLLAWTQNDDGQTQVRSLLIDTSTFVTRGATALIADPPTQCPPEKGIAVQVLGSGGPIADDARASTSYLVWVDGKSRAMIDAGGGSFLRFGEARARFSDLDFIGLSHFHTDHSADFPAILKSGFFSRRERNLAIAGPDGSGPFPSLSTYLDSMLNSGNGAYGYLSGYLDGSGGLVRLEPTEVAREARAAVLVHESDRMRIHAMHVPHGIVPALAFRVSIGDKRLVFSSDQNLGNEHYLEFARGADLLAVHMPLPEGATSGTQLHAVPSEIGAFVSNASPETLLLSHFMRRSLVDLERNISLVGAEYEGTLLVAEDLFCHVVE